jgi:hypothetical protein
MERESEEEMGATENLRARPIRFPPDQLAASRSRVSERWHPAEHVACSRRKPRREVVCYKNAQIADIYSSRLLHTGETGG